MNFIHKLYSRGKRLVAPARTDCPRELLSARRSPQQQAWVEEQEELRRQQQRVLHEVGLGSRPDGLPLPLWLPLGESPGPGPA